MGKLESKTVRKSLGERLAMWVVGILAAIVGVFLFEVVFGRVTGTELDPATLEQRAFVYFRIPFTRIQVTPPGRMSRSDDLADYLSTNNWVSPAAAPKWHIVDVQMGSTYITGNAIILTNLLSRKTAGNEFYWLAWSKEHPQKAKVFWPLVSQAARNDAYVLLPDFFAAAGTITDDGQFQREIPRTLASLCAALAKDHSDAQQFDAAIGLYSLAISHDADSAALRRARAACYAKMGNTAKAHEDESAAATLERKGVGRS